MFNLNDEVVQTIKLSLLELKIHNRNILIDGTEDLGYSKKLKDNYLSTSSEDGFKNLDQSKKAKYDLKWKFIFSEEEIGTLFEIISTHNLNVRSMKKSSYNLYGGEVLFANEFSKIILVDNKTKDFLTNEYEQYEIIITKVDNLSLFKVERSNTFYTIEIEGETLN